MDSVGAYEAKTHLPRLLRRVMEGESVTITRHGRPIARLVPVEENERTRAYEAHDDRLILDLARRHRLSVYDAAYVETSLRRSLPLASLDRRLREAAEASGAALVRP